ncbi:unnamed protein product [Thlaspi arvense]|uniref:Potassium transporter n=1 Tax=Thlaspi arvense TaxID=13288 RepID=A0AAU9SI88_THLAR|nr:unnamed protein product [Thlaspi arvense]
MDIESRSYQNILKKESWRTVLTLAYQSLGVVYGDLSISPLYVYKSTFAEDIHHSESNEEIFGVLSFIFWTITLVPLFKYVFIVLRADDNGEGGTFALYSLLCRHARVNSLPSCQLADEQLIEYKTDSIGSSSAVPQSGFAASLKSTLEKHRVLQKILLFSLQYQALSFQWLRSITNIEVPAACIILVGLFALQHYGTHRVGFLFAPVILLWLVCISAIGVYNIFHWNPQVYQALSPYYMYKFLKKTQSRGWMSLGGILLCITGSEAMFADLGHFSQLSIKIAFTSLVYPSLILAYMGQAAYLSQHHVIESDYNIGIYHSFSSLQFGLAVITVMLVTTCLMSLVIVLCWHKSVLFAIAFVVFFGTIEALYFSASLIKFLEGAWVPIALSLCFLAAMCTWHYGTLKRYEFDVQNKVSVNWLLSLGQTLGIKRVRGIGLIHTELVSGIPAIFSHFVTNLPAFHQVLVFLCVKSVPVPHVRPEERFLVGRIGPKQFRIYRCIVRYGYRDVHKDDIEFEGDLVCSIAEFIRSEAETATMATETNGEDEDSHRMAVVGTCSTYMQGIEDQDVSDYDDPDKPGTSEIRSPKLKKKKSKIKKKVRFVVPETPKIEKETREELMELTEAREGGVAYIMGNAYMRAKPGSGLVKRLAINVGYEFLRRNTRGPRTALTSPHASTLEVGMIYHV